MRELASQVSNPRTTIQMTQRVKWANLVSFYRANKSWMKKAFETKKPTQSDYNVFMSKNITSSPIYLTKEMASAGGCVVSNYKVSDGSLQQVESYANGDDWVTNIFTGTMNNITAETKVGDFSKALLSANAGLRQFDQLSFIRVTQLTNNVTGVPYIQVRAYEMILNETSARLVTDFMPLDVLFVSQLQEQNALGVQNNNNNGAWAMIISRNEGGSLLVSPATLTLVNMADFKAQYTRPAALDAAIASYGTGNDVFLSTETAFAKQTTPVTLSVVGLSIGGVEQTLSNVKLTSGQTLNNVKVTFSADVEGDPELIKVTNTAGSTTYGSTSDVQVNAANKSVVEANAAITTTTVQSTTTGKIVVIISGASYEIPITIETKAPLE